MKKYDSSNWPPFSGTKDFDDGMLNRLIGTVTVVMAMSRWKAIPNAYDRILTHEDNYLMDLF